VALGKLSEGKTVENTWQVEMPVVPLLVTMEVLGVAFEQASVEHLIHEVEVVRKPIVSQIHQMAGEEFNIDSPEQVAHVLYDKLKLPAPAMADG